MTGQTRRSFIQAGLIALIAVVALLPWWRNHSYLRDLYDYGLVLAANGYMDLGERPYVDFTTPIQAGFLGLNWLIERLGGGTYFALTLGGAGLSVVTSTLLTAMLARRWPWWAAAVVGGAVSVAGASQHTILWHNALGVFCLALVTWAAACAPVLRRTHWPWHLLMVVGLFLGGINKLNFQLVAVAVALAWAMRAGLLRQAGWGRVAATVAGVLLAGLVLPIAAELAWTGASLQLWLANVVQLASASRLGILRQVLSADFLLHPLHDYYGPLLLRPVGLVGLGLSLAALVGCWPGRAAVSAGAGGDRWLLPLAAGLAATAGAALLATNFEIATLGLGAWLVLVVSLWLGFAPAGRRAVFIGGLIVPAAVLGVAAWWSAWLGQRSQFGFSPAPRAEYQPAESAGPAFARLAGLRLPPDVMTSLLVVEQSLPEIDESYRPVFYGPGLEFLDRFYPSLRDKRQPLWGHWGTTYSHADVSGLAGKLGEDGRYRAVFVVGAFDFWPVEVQAQLNRYYVKDLVGPRIRRWSRRDKNSIDLADSFDALARLGGNVDSHFLLIDQYPLQSRQIADGTLALGTTRRDGCVLVCTPANRVRAVAVLERLPGAGAGPLFADFKAIIHGSTPENQRWAVHVELPAGQQSVSVPFEADAGGQLLQLWVSQPAAKPPVLFAGFRELEITQAVEAAGAPRLRPAIHADVPVNPELAASLFGIVAWRPGQLVVRGWQPSETGLELPAGGELWLHTDNMVGEIWGQLALPAGASHTALARVLWYKGGRLQLLQQARVEPGQPVDFHAGTAEPGGWIGVMLDAGDGAAPVQVRVTRSTLTP